MDNQRLEDKHNSNIADLAATFELARIKCLIPANLIILVSDQGEFGESTVTTAPIKRADILDVFKQYNNRFRQVEILEGLDTWEKIRECFVEITDTIGLHTEAEFLTIRAGKTRERLEKLASTIAREDGVTVGSLDFIRCLHLRIERTREYRQGLREDGLCIGYGVNASQWLEEHDASQSETSELHEILDWLESQCPLLMAQYRNAQLQQAK